MTKEEALERKAQNARDLGLNYEPEPVAWEQFHEHKAGPNYVAPQSTWVGLKDDDEIPWDGVDAKSFAKAIEAKLKELNT